MKLLYETPTLVSAAELSEIVGIDIETVNNWLRHGTITRARIGGRQLRNRLFSVEEVYRTALINELVMLGNPPSSAGDAINALWKKWDKRETPEGWNVYAVLVPRNGKWNVALCSQKVSGGPLYKLEKSMGIKSIEEIDLPKQTFVMIPVSDVFDRVEKNFQNYWAK